MSTRTELAIRRARAIQNLHDARCGRARWIASEAVHRRASAVAQQALETYGARLQSMRCPGSFQLLSSELIGASSESFFCSAMRSTAIALTGLLIDAA